jgi:hypothetical protein
VRSWTTTRPAEPGWPGCRGIAGPAGLLDCAEVTAGWWLAAGELQGHGDVGGVAKPLPRSSAASDRLDQVVSGLTRELAGSLIDGGKPCVQVLQMAELGLPVQTGPGRVGCAA